MIWDRHGARVRPLECVICIGVTTHGFNFRYCIKLLVYIDYTMHRLPFRSWCNVKRRYCREYIGTLMHNLRTHYWSHALFRCNSFPGHYNIFPMVFVRPRFMVFLCEFSIWHFALVEYMILMFSQLTATTTSLHYIKPDIRPTNHISGNIINSPGVHKTDTFTISGKCVCRFELPWVC